MILRLNCVKHKKIVIVLCNCVVFAFCYKYDIILNSTIYKSFLNILCINKKTFRKKITMNVHKNDIDNHSNTNSSVFVDVFCCHRDRLEILFDKNLSISWNKKLKNVQLNFATKNFIAFFNDKYNLKIWLFYWFRRISFDNLSKSMFENEISSSFLRCV